MFLEIFQKLSGGSSKLSGDS